MNNETIFADGVNVYTPNSNAPDFVKASLVIRVDDFKKWVESNDNRITTDKEGNRVLRMQIKESKQGKLYASVDNYQPDGNKVIAQAARDKAYSNIGGASDIDNFPF